MFFSVSLFQLYLFCLIDLTDLVEYCIKRDVDAKMHTYVNQEHQKKKNLNPGCSHSGSCTADR